MMDTPYCSSLQDHPSLPTSCIPQTSEAAKSTRPSSAKCVGQRSLQRVALYGKTTMRSDHINDLACTGVSACLYTDSGKHVLIAR